MNSPSMDATNTGACNYVSVTLDPSDRYDLTVLQAEVRSREQELQLARIRLDAARAVSDAAADKVLARMGLRPGASDVTIDLTTGSVSYPAFESGE